MQLNLLYQFNEKYVTYAGVSLYSILYNNKHMEDICIFILGENLGNSSKEKIKQMVQEFQRRVVFVATDQLITKMKDLNMPTYRGSYAANMRLFLDDVLDVSVKKVLYLDADTIVNRKLDGLIETDLGGNSIGMVLDSLGEPHKKQIGLKPSDGYYNSGVILFDMDNWRKKKYSDKIAEHVNMKRNNYPAPDQDLLNVVCRNDILRLDARYNLQPVHIAFSDEQYCKIIKTKIYYSREELREARNNAVIFHCFRFIGEFPWHEGNFHPNNYLFDRYLKASPWKGYKKKKSELGMILKIEKILYKVVPKFIFLYLFKIAHAVFLYKSNQDSMKGRINKLM